MKLVSILTLMLAAVAVGASPLAFRDVRSKTPVPANLQDRTVVRIRPAILDKSLFSIASANKLNSRKRRDTSASNLVRMNFFQDATLTARWTTADKNEQGGLVWTGSVEGSRFGQAVLIVTGTSVMANITRGDGRVYQIRTTENGSLWLREIDQSKFPGEGAPK